MSTCNCKQIIIKLRQGDDSNYNSNHIIFHIGKPEEHDLTGWKAKFQLQNLTWNYDEIKNNQIELVVNQHQTNSLDVGSCYGWLQLIDNEGKQGTVYTQPFKILRREVF